MANDGGDVLGLLEGAATDLAGGGNRDGDGAERNRCGVGNQHDRCGAQWLDAQSENHGRGNGDGGAEACEGLEQSAEAERDEHGLDAHVTVAHLVKHEPQIFEAARGDRDLVEPDRRHDDKDDGEQAEQAAAEGGGDGHSHGHVEAKDGDQQGGDEGDEAGEVRAGFHTQQHDEEGEQRDRRHQCGKADAAPDCVGEDLELVHVCAPWLEGNV